MLTTFGLKNSLQASKIDKNSDCNGQLFAEVQDEKEQKGSHQESFHSKDYKSQNTLGCLTKKFVELIKKAPNRTIEIDEASQTLDIQKRRIYDITNVLEGIGYIEKLGKNLMKWVGGQIGSELEREVNELQMEQDHLQDDIKKVESQIEDIQSQIISLTKNSRYSYFTVQDIIKIMNSLQVKKIIVYVGEKGDLLEIGSQCTIESKSTLTKLYLCQMKEDQTLEVIQNPQFDNKIMQKMLKVDKTPTKLQIIALKDFSLAPNCDSIKAKDVILQQSIRVKQRQQQKQTSKKEDIQWQKRQQEHQQH